MERRRRILYPLQVSAENLISGIRDRAAKLKLPVSPNLRRKSFVIAWLERQPFCDCCGVPFHFGPKDGRARDASPSFDRFDSSKGYIEGNVFLLCWRCNNIKRNYTSQDLRIVASWIESKVARNEVGKFGGVHVE